jgi:NADPH-dependent 2,4-dienoyl-CoA reductase/sulfur reductase-like enzyme/nitrite reductase/ring-hydroxylating ferredoxin subunit
MVRYQAWTGIKVMEILMAEEKKQPSGPDLTQGIPSTDLADGGMIAGHIGTEAVLLARRGNEVFAIGATCTHYGGPLAEGLLVGDTVRCPWHHACFSLRTGEAVRAPALAPVACWRIEQRDGKVFVGEKQKPERRQIGAGLNERIVIVGGGAAGFAAAQMLRREGYAGEVALISADEAPPYDRPNLSKDYLAGKVPAEWIPLRKPDFYPKNGIDLHLNATATRIDTDARQVLLSDRRSFAFDQLLLATGAEPVRLAIPGADRPHVHTLRSLADSRAIIAGAETARRAVVLGASFIGLEVAAALRTRGLDVHVVAPELLPMERILGPQLGQFIQELHKSNGVTFHLGQTAAAIEATSVTLNDGREVAADLVVAGIGVRPRTALAETAGLRLDRGILVDQFLESSVPGIFAAGDVARWPDPHSGESLRIEHWVVAQRQGQTAARNMLGRREPFAAVPFFWSQHYDAVIAYVGHASSWDELTVEGDLGKRDCVIRYVRGNRIVAVATISRDLDSLNAEVDMERALFGARIDAAADKPGAAPALSPTG